jgi:beta-lactamase superfamily II metal-dependent hydrolase
LVLLGEFHGTRVLSLADLGRPGQETLMQRETNLQADIVITGLPEQGEALCDGLIEMTKPKLIIVADSEFPATKRATPALLDRLARHNVRVLSTRNTGAATIHIDPSGWRIELMHDAKADARAPAQFPAP